MREKGGRGKAASTPRDIKVFLDSGSEAEVAGQISSTHLLRELVEEEGGLLQTSVQEVESALALDSSGHRALTLTLASKWRGTGSEMQVTHGLGCGAG